MNATEFIITSTFIGVTCDECGKFTNSPSIYIYDHNIVVCPACSDKLANLKLDEDDDWGSDRMTSDNMEEFTEVCVNCGTYFYYFGGRQLCSVCRRI